MSRSKPATPPPRYCKSRSRLSRTLQAVLQVAALVGAGCAATWRTPELNLFDPLINQYVYTPISRIPADWTGDCLLLFPLQRSLEGASWKTAYCPTDFLQTGRLGSWTELEQLCTRSRKEGRGVGADLVLGHCCLEGLKPAPPFVQEEMGPEGQWGTLIDYSQASARAKGCTIIQHTLQTGVSLLRFDAVSQIPVPQLRELVGCAAAPGILKILETSHSRPQALALLAALHDPSLKTFDMQWLFEVTRALQTNLHDLQSAVPMPFELCVLPLDNHDLLLRASGSADPTLNEFFERTKAGDWTMSFPLTRFVGLTAYSLPSLVCTTEHSLAENLAVESLRDEASLQALKPILAIRPKIRHLPLYWTRNSLPETVASYQRGSSYLFVCAHRARERACVVEHALRPGRYRELLSGALFDVDAQPIVFEDLTSNLYALEYQGPIPAREFQIPPVVHMIWCQGWSHAPQVPGPESFERCGLTVERWDAQRFENRILPHLPAAQQRAYARIASLEFENPRWRYMVQSDFMRLAILARHGGYYADLDCLCHWPFQRHFEDYAFVAGLQQDGRINNAFLGAIPQSPVVLDLLEAASSRLLALEGRCHDVCYPAGPVLFSERVRPSVGTLILPFGKGIGYDGSFYGRHCYVSHWYASWAGDTPPALMAENSPCLYTPGVASGRQRVSSDLRDHPVSQRVGQRVDPPVAGYPPPYAGRYQGPTGTDRPVALTSASAAPAVAWDPWRHQPLPAQIDPSWLRIPGTKPGEAY